jgi:hypothetical protein
MKVAFFVKDFSIEDGTTWVEIDCDEGEWLSHEDSLLLDAIKRMINSRGITAKGVILADRLADGKVKPLGVILAD